MQSRERQRAVPQAHREPALAPNLWKGMVRSHGHAVIVVGAGPAGLAAACQAAGRRQSEDCMGCVLAAGRVCRSPRDTHRAPPGTDSIFWRPAGHDKSRVGARGLHSGGWQTLHYIPGALVDTGGPALLRVPRALCGTTACKMAIGGRPIRYFGSVLEYGRSQAARFGNSRAFPHAGIYRRNGARWNQSHCRAKTSGGLVLERRLAGAPSL